MTYREKNIAPPDILTSLPFEMEILDAIATHTAIYQTERYGHNEVRKALKLIYGEKCAYCECKIAPASNINVDHYRPVNSYATAINPQSHLGYYWLGYEWTNLIQACSACNQTKSSKFHLSISANRQIAAPLLLGLIPNYNEHGIGSLHLSNEDPLLINPERVDPDIHLYVDYFGLLQPRDASFYGESTIDICDLNRDSLYSERSGLINSYIIAIENEIFERYREDALASSAGQYQHRLNLIFQEIIAQNHIDNEYNMTARSIVERFDELILEDIEYYFRKEIRAFFIDFLNSL